MKIAVVGSGGREHALGWKIKQSPLVKEVIGVPGNAGWQQIGPCWTDIKDPAKELPDRCKTEGVDLVVIGPEQPLVDGLADALADAGIAAFGPKARGAAFEGSKILSKEFMQRHKIPTADFAVFEEVEPARAYVQAQGVPIVIKADGLAAGKGVVVAQTLEEADKAIVDMLENQTFGEAGQQIVIEACLPGEEVSVIAITDGKTIRPLMPSQDHKRIFDNDEGPNTGGMGAYVPTGLVTPELWSTIEEQVLQPTLKGFQADGIDFCGVIYCGLMVEQGKPGVLEYNVRFGDPECQPLMVHLKSDLVPYLKACTEGTLADQPEFEWHAGFTICVVMASKGYPASAEKGVAIPGLPGGENQEAIVFQAGVKQDGDDIVTNGGRVLGVTAQGDTIEQARTKAYTAVDQHRWPGCQVRSDIGWREVARQDNTTGI